MSEWIRIRISPDGTQRRSEADSEAVRTLTGFGWTLELKTPHFVVGSARVEMHNFEKEWIVYIHKSLIEGGS